MYVTIDVSLEKKEAEKNIEKSARKVEFYFQLGLGISNTCSMFTC